MQLEIQTHGIALTAKLQAYIERRLRFALSWAAYHIRRIEVRCIDENGPRGGIGNRCTLHLRLQRGDELIIKDIQANIWSAIERAVDRASRTLARKLRRQQDFRNLSHRSQINWPDTAGEILRQNRP